LVVGVLREATFSRAGVVVLIVGLSDCIMVKVVVGV